MEEAVIFFRTMLDLPCPRIAVENPVPHRHGIGKTYTQVVQPFQFGHGETKKTCLWLKGLPPLRPTKIVLGRKPRSYYESPGPDRWRRRSVTYAGIAEAMAEQWGSL